MILQTGSEEVIGLLPKRHVQQIGLCEKNRKRAIIMAYKVIILYRLYMPSYFLGTFTEYPRIARKREETTQVDVLFELIINKSVKSSPFRMCN